MIKAFTAKEHAEELCRVHEVDVQTFHAMSIILGAQICIAENLHEIIIMNAKRGKSQGDAASCWSKVMASYANARYLLDVS